MTAEAQPRRVAVIAVHGVADQHAGDTARDLTEQLSALSQFDPQAAKYSAWTHEPMRIAVAPVPLAPFETPEKKEKGGGWSSAFLHSEFAAQYFDARPMQQPALEFMSKRLSGYRGDPDNQGYEVTRFCGRRLDVSSGRVTAEVDVYEMYWADLSRLGTGLLSILGEFYQLLFHLTIVGRLTVDLARSAIARGTGTFKERNWRCLSELHASASWVLSVPIALLNFVLIMLATIALPVAVPEAWRPAAAGIAYGALAGAGAAAYRSATRRPWVSTWGAGIGLAAAMGVFCLLYATETARFGATHALALAWGLAIAGLTVWGSSRLSRHMGAARGVGHVIAAVVTVAFAALVIQAPNTSGGVVLATMRVVDGLFMLLFALWFLLVLLHLGAWLAGAAAWLGADAAERRAIRTGRIGIALPTGLFIVVTLGVWAAIKGTLIGYLPVVEYTPIFIDAGGVPLSSSQYVDKLLENSAGRGFNVLLLLMLAGGLCMLWAVLPALIAELSPPAPVDERRSKGLGGWLDEGVVWGSIGVGVLVFAVVFWLPAVRSLMEFFPGLKDTLGGYEMLVILASVMTGSAVGVVALSRYSDVVLKGVRSVLDIALDVDQWLREQPNSRTPTARICARYASLLRHLIEWRGRDGRGYDAVVIVSHSQGTIITTELLRFIKAGYVDPKDPVNSLGRELPVRLMTVGSPLRQLYSRRFPHLYHWAADPGMADLGVDRWTNAYFSGDYVGRYLWRSDTDGRNWIPVEEAWKPGSPHPAVDVHKDGRVEFCLGAGAHTHYFDGTSRLVARAADQLVAA